jgi:hypothetical protein
MLITFVITYVLTRLFYAISGFDPLRIIPKWPSYLLDLGIWLLASYIIFRALSALGIGKARDRKTGSVQG